MNTAGHEIVRSLENHDVKRVYVVPGESFLDVLDGLHDSKINTVVCRQEGGAGFMALAEGRLGDVPGVAMVTRGPGAANALIAIHTAYQDATAMVLFVGLVPIRDRYRESFQEFHLEGWFGSTTKRVMILEDPNRAAETVNEAMHVAASGRPGPVVVGVPEDILQGLTSCEPSAPRALSAPAPSAAHMNQVREMFTAAAKPLLIVGGDGWHGRTGRQLADFALRNQIPVMTDWRAYDAVPHDHPAYAGWLGYGRSASAAKILADADLLVFVGCVRSDVMSEGFTCGQHTPTVVFSPDSVLLQHSGRVDCQILSTPRDTAAALADMPSCEGNRTSNWFEDARRNQREFSSPKPDKPRFGVDLGEAMGILDEVLPKERVLTFGAGNATIWAHRYISHDVPNSLVGARNGAMGLAVPAAVTASLMFPERRAVAVCGDGDFLMNGQEITVAAAQGSRPLFLVIDNSQYGTIVQHQQRQYPGRASGTNLHNPDFAMWMRGLGHFGARVESTDEFASQLQVALEHDGPALLHLIVDPEQLEPVPFTHEPKDCP